MERKDFLRAGALFTGAALFTRDVHAAQDIQGMGLDKLCLLYTSDAADE